MEDVNLGDSDAQVGDIPDLGTGFDVVDIGGLVTPRGDVSTIERKVNRTYYTKFVGDVMELYLINFLLSERVRAYLGWGIEQIISTSTLRGSLGLKDTVQPLMSLRNSGGTLLSVSSSGIGGAAVFEVCVGTGAAAR